MAVGGLFDDGAHHEPTRSLGPNRELVPAPSEEVSDHFQVYAEDGITCVA